MKRVPGTFLEPFGTFCFRQLNNIFAGRTDSDVSGGWAEVFVYSGDGPILAYASVVDNLTGDSVYIPAQ